MSLPFSSEESRGEEQSSSGLLEAHGGEWDWQRSVFTSSEPAENLVAIKRGVSIATLKGATIETPTVMAEAPIDD